ncbi:hypothetical protein ACFLWA_03810 [Chloroflexota bacterium]
MEYKSEGDDLKGWHDALQIPEKLAIEQAAQVIKDIAYAWEDACLSTRRELLRVVFQAVCVDVMERGLQPVRPHADFIPLFRLGSLEEKEDGPFCYRPTGEVKSEGRAVSGSATEDDPPGSSM